jgi:hypothetical protein
MEVEGVKKLNINGTTQEIEILENAAKNAKGKMAILFDSLRRANEILHSLSMEEFEQLIKESENHPALKSIIVNDISKMKMEKESIHEGLNLPGFLTVSDVSEMLNITPQMVRKHCAAGKIKAWRTLGDSGEWRIDVDQYKSHPNIEPIIEKYHKRNRDISEMVANSPDLTHQFQRAKERRDDPSYYHDDIDRFNKMVDEDDE